MDNFCINKTINSNGLKKCEYDAVIIGAGIGGLTCGCYLAKAGLKTLIVEQHHKVGGYCTSFKRGGFTFDAGVHALGSCREDGQLGKLFRDLELHKKVKLIESDPTDIIITPDYKIRIRKDINATIDDLQRNFPHEAEGIKNFFVFMDSFDLTSNFRSIYLQLKGKTFKDLLDQYFSDLKLKAILAILLGNIGLPSTETSIISGIIMFREFILDGGRYPKGGMQAFADALAEKFKEYGGELFISRMVTKIKVGPKEVNGVILDGDNYIFSNYVVSNCDARQTFLELIGEEFLKKDFVDELNRMIPSISLFVVYLGLDYSLGQSGVDSCGLWYFPDYDIDKIYLDLFQGKVNYFDKGLLASFPSLHDHDLAPPGKESVCLITGALYKDEAYWKRNRSAVADEIIKRFEEVIPDLSKHILVKEIATPITLFKYTLNTQGAMHGWASILSQTNSSIISPKGPLKGLFLAGHWITQPAPGGIPMVVFSGRTTAKLILAEVERE